MSNIVKGSGIIYTTGVPNTLPNQGTDAEFAIDINGNQYAWNRTNKVWDNMGQAIEIATSSAAPTHTPSNFRPRFLVTPSRDFYFYSGSAWGLVGSLPSGLISSSGQIGPTGIYSGSGFIPTSSVATLDSFTGQEQYQVKLLFDAIGNYQGGWGNGFRQFGVESSNFDNSIFTFAGFQDDGDQVTYLIRSIDVSKDRDTLLRVTSDFFRVFTNNISLTSYDGIEYATIEMVDNNIYTDTSNGKGIQYVGNYTSSFTTSSLIDRRYADKHIAFSSSAAATSASLISGRGGIYNGSGVIPSQTTASVNYTGTGGVTYTGSLMFFGRSPYDNLKGYNVRRFGFHNHVTGSAYGFAGFVSNSGSAFEALSAVSQSFGMAESRIGVYPQNIRFFADTGTGMTSSGEFNPLYGFSYLTQKRDRYESDNAIVSVYDVKQLLDNYTVPSASHATTGGGIYNGSGTVPDGTSANINGTCYFNFNSIFSTFGIGDMDGNYYGMRTTATNDTVTIGNTAGLGDQYFIVTQKGGDEQIELNSQYKINIHTNTLAFLFNNSTQTAIFSDNSEVPLGIQYEQNYSDTLADLSLVPKKYVDDRSLGGFFRVDSTMLTGSKGAYTYDAVITPNRKRIFFDAVGDISICNITVESGSYPDGYEIETIFRGTTASNLLYNFNIYNSVYDFSTVTGDLLIVRFAYFQYHDSWQVINYVSSP